LRGAAQSAPRKVRRAKCAAQAPRKVRRASAAQARSEDVLKKAGNGKSDGNPRSVFQAFHNV